MGLGLGGGEGVWVGDWVSGTSRGRFTRKKREVASAERWYNQTAGTSSNK